MAKKKPYKLPNKDVDGKAITWLPADPDYLEYRVNRRTGKLYHPHRARGGGDEERNPATPASQEPGPEISHDTGHRPPVVGAEGFRADGTDSGEYMAGQCDTGKKQMKDAPEPVLPAMADRLTRAASPDEAAGLLAEQLRHNNRYNLKRKPENRDSADLIPTATDAVVVARQETPVPQARSRYHNAGTEKQAASMIKRHDEQWFRNLETFCYFLIEHERAPRAGEKYQGLDVGNWMKDQRLRLKQGKMPAHRYRILGRRIPCWNSLSFSTECVQAWLVAELSSKVIEGWKTPLIYLSGSDGAELSYREILLLSHRELLSCEDLQNMSEERLRLLFPSDGKPGTDMPVLEKAILLLCEDHYGLPPWNLQFIRKIFSKDILWAFKRSPLDVLAENIHRLLRTLKEADRSLIQDRYVRGLSNKTIGKELGIGTAEAKWRNEELMRRIRDSARETLLGNA